MTTKDNIIEALQSKNVNSIDLLLLAFDFEFMQETEQPNHNLEKIYAKHIELASIKLPILLNVTTDTIYIGLDNRYIATSIRIVYVSQSGEMINSHFIKGDETKIYNSLKLILQTI
jgi:hypothetical protein